VVWGSRRKGGGGDSILAGQGPDLQDGRESYGSETLTSLKKKGFAKILITSFGENCARACFQEGKKTDRRQKIKKKEHLPMGSTLIYRVRKKRRNQSAGREMKKNSPSSEREKGDSKKKEDRYKNEHSEERDRGWGAR